MTTTESSSSSSALRLISGIVVISLIAAAAIWWPQVSKRLGLKPTSSAVTEAAHGADDAHNHDEHTGHDHAGHDDASSLELSATAKQNLGLTPEFLRPLQVSTYRRSITIPAVIAARPGRSQIQVSTPLTGVVTHVHAVAGEAVTPGMLLFEIQLTHEELVTAQTDFLKTLGELDVEKQEIARLEGVAESGAISGRNLIERKYSRDKLTAVLRALREALKLHGLSDRQVDEIERDRKLLRSLSIVAPDIDRHSESEELHLSDRRAIPVSFITMDEDQTDAPKTGSADQHVHESHGSQEPPTVSSGSRPLVIGDLSVIKGQSVAAGEKLCVVSDLETLFVEGQAFDQDAGSINIVAEKNWPLTALIPGEKGPESISDLKLAYVGTEVDLHARTLSLFAELPNRVIRDVTNEAQQRFVTWQYRPGQRLQLQVPVEEWSDQIVVPVDAVSIEGPEAFVFRQNGSHFDRVAVHMIHRDQTNVVLANDGSVFPGDVIALRSAHQMQMAIKNKSGAGADPHAGHSH
jgi:membrane fusion protein, heavy metal efflux system